MKLRFSYKGLYSLYKVKSEKTIMGNVEHLVVELAWADDVSFEAIKEQTGRNEKQVIQLMRKSLKPSSFKIWRARVNGRRKKHGKRSDAD